MMSERTRGHGDNESNEDKEDNEDNEDNVYNEDNNYNEDNKDNEKKLREMMFLLSLKVTSYFSLMFTTITNFSYFLQVKKERRHI